jgi:hypothetical protein
MDTGMTKRRNFSDKFKATVALEALRGDKTVQEIAAKRQLHPMKVSTWKWQAIEGLTAVFCKRRSQRRGAYFLASLSTGHPLDRNAKNGSKGCLSLDGMLHLMLKLGQCAEQNARKLRGFDCLAKVITGVTFKDGIETTNPDQIAA